MTGHIGKTENRPEIEAARLVLERMGLNSYPLKHVRA